MPQAAVDQGSRLVPYLLICTEICGRTLKQWLERHKKRNRKKMFIFFEQVSFSPSYSCEGSMHFFKVFERLMFHRVLLLNEIDPQ